MFVFDVVCTYVMLGFMATATVSSCHKTDSQTRAEIHVSLVFERQNIMSSSCSECHDQVWCEHVIAVVLYRIKHARDVCITWLVTSTVCG